MTESATLQVAEVGARFDAALENFRRLATESGNPEALQVYQGLMTDVAELKQRGVVNMAFVGQYNAGKSTMMSALTGRRDITVHSDIATGETASFDWHGVKLIDTPGIFTDRDDHDAITYEAIKHADLLVFCLTYSLFDTITLANFKKLAFDLNYRRKMMLVVNKMADEAGEEAVKLAAYKGALTTALAPHSLDEFRVCYVDAKEYCEGVDEQDDELRQFSRFDTLTTAINEFVAERSALARLDTPVRLTLSRLDDLSTLLLRSDAQDSAYLEILARLSRVSAGERRRMRTKVRSAILDMQAAIKSVGLKIAQSLGDADQQSLLTSRAEIDIQQACETASDQVADIIANSMEKLDAETQSVFSGQLANHLLARIDVSGPEVSLGLNMPGNAAERLRSQASSLKGLQKVCSEQLGRFGTGASSAGKAGLQLLTAKGVSGSAAHATIKNVGNFFGKKFKPWEAVNMAKNVGNVVKVAGVALSVVSMAMDVVAMFKESEEAQKLADARRDIIHEFDDMADDIASQFNEQLHLVEVELFDDLDRRIAESRQTEEDQIASGNRHMALLTGVRKELTALVNEINAPTRNRPQAPVIDVVTQPAEVAEAPIVPTLPEAASSPSPPTGPQAALELNRQGFVLAQSGDWDGAKSLFEQAITADPLSAKAHINLANVYVRQKQAPQAKALYQRVLELDPNNATAHTNLGVILLRMGDKGGAIASLARALALNPGNASAQKYMQEAMMAMDLPMNK